MEIYGINRKEIRHTSFLRWLFSPNCEIAKIALKQMLDIIVASNHFKDKMLNDELYKLIVIGNYEIDSWSSKENHTINGGEIDLHIALTINNYRLELVIENKIYSNEHEDQTQRYYDFITKTNREASKLFVYLSPISSIELEKLENAQCCCKNYIQLNYQVLVDKIIEPLLSETLNKTTNYILEDYLKALSTPVNIKQKNYKFMAISNRESELLTKFWTENEDLILKAVEATKENTHIEPEKRETAKKIGELLKSDGERIGAYAKRTLLALFQSGKITSDEIIQFQEFNYSKITFGINYPLLNKKENENEKPLHYWKDVLKIDNEEYFMCCEWFEKSRTQLDEWLKSIS